MTGTVEIFVGLLLAVTVLAVVARKLKIPYPILFVIGGSLLGFIPKLPQVRLDPDLIFFFVLPPALFPAALFTSWRDFRANLRPISLLAIGLVLLTTVAVAYLSHYLFGLPLAVGFVLGAIISPPDAVAATAIAERLKVPHRVITILEGESLVNDATALIAYRFAVVAVVTGSFSLAQAGAQFFVVGIGGIVVGVVVGWLAEQFHRRIDDPPIEITVSLLTPYVAYLLAEQLRVSGVLAVVAAGLYLGWRLPEIFTSQTRLRAGPVWETVEFLLNGFVFILIGLQLPEILKTLSKDSDSVRHLVWPALVISVAVILVRILWVFPAAYFPRLFSKGLRKRDPYPTWQSLTILAWTGMRGVVSLAAALALPMAIRNGNPFPDRELILFLTFIVIVVTLVGQGLSLPFVIRLLHMEEDLSFEQEELKARLQANKAALEKLTETPENDPAKADARQRLRIEYEDHIRQLESNEPDTAGTPLRLFSSEFERLSQAALNEERRTIIDLRNRRAINDEVLRRIQRDIDLAEARLRHHQ